MSPKQKQDAIDYHQTLKYNAQKKAAIDAYLDVVVGGGSGSGDASAAAQPTASEGRALSCSPLGLLGVKPALVAQILTWDRKTKQKVEELC